MALTMMTGVSGCSDFPGRQQPDCCGLPKHAAQMRRVFSELSAEELRDFEMALKRIGKRAARLLEKSSSVSQVEKGDQE
jgi:hypothetical protein